MKIFHLSDLHIGLKLINQDLLEDQRFILQQIVQKAKENKADVIVIAGDIYDKSVPSAESVDLFDEFVFDMTKALPDAHIMMISGNHDSASRVNVFRKILQRQRVHMIGFPPEKEEDHIEKITLEDDFGKVNFYLLPFVKPSMVKAIVGTSENGNNLSYDETLHKLIEREDIDERERNVIVSHQFYLPIGCNAEDVERMDSEIHTVGNIDEVKSDILERFDYAALGHIHKPMKVGSEFVRYCGTPIACSLSEKNQQKSIIEVELLEKGNVHTKTIDLKPLREVKQIKGTLKEVLEQKCDDYVSVVLTDEVDLNIFDMNDRLRNAFPRLLEVHRENVKKSEYAENIEQMQSLDVFELCNCFLQDLDDKEKEILKDIINTVQGGDN